MIEKKEPNKNKRILIIILLIISTILAILLCILHILSTLRNNNVIDDKFTSKISTVKENPENYSLEEVLKAFDCKNISYSVEKDEDGNYYYDINLLFKYRLYEKNISQEQYFNDIVNTLKNKLNNIFILTDERKNIEIYVDKYENIYTINGVEDYFNNNYYIEVNSHKKIKTEIIPKNSNELNLISINGWSRSNLKLDKEPISITSEWIDYGDFKENYSDININYVIFTKDYESEVVSNIKVDTSFKEIQKSLGEPHFKYSNEMIGYKMNDLYAFFYDNEIVIYPNLNINNLSFEQTIINYYNGNYNGYRTEFVREILENYNDFKSEIVEDGVKLYSYTRGIELYLNDDKTMKIVVYDNYNFSDVLKTHAESGKVELNLDEDFVYLFEINRNN